jgi:hypothetical protein
VKPTLSGDTFYKRTAIAAIAGFFIIRGIIAFNMELGIDEAYYWFYSQDVKWNYYDHPPMVAIWIRLFTANLTLQETEGFVRLGSVVGCAMAAWFMYKTVTTIHSPKAGWYAVILYHASIYATVTTGIFIMPDTPQMVFYLLALWMVARITKAETKWLVWIVFGVASGLCILSKVYGVFLWTGLALFAILKKREWFSQPYIYVAFGLTALLASPILLWNIQNDFITFRFHSARADVTQGSFEIINFCREVINQLFYNNPVNVLISIVALVAFLKKRKANVTGNEALSIFNFMALPLALLLLLLSVFRDTTLPHWSGPAYVALIPLTAIHLTNRTIRFSKRLLFSSLSVLFAFLVIWQYLIHFAPETIGIRDVDNQKFRAGKEMIKKLFSGFESFQLIAETKNSYEPAGDSFAKLYRQETSSGVMEKSSPVICYKWWGAHIEYYFCHPFGIPVIGLGEPDELHEYLFTNVKRKDRVSLNTAYCIVPADDYYNVQSKYSAYYHQIEKPMLITVKRNGKPDVIFYVYRLRGWKSRLPVADSK